MKSLQELAEEAFADLLKKHGRPVTLKQALKESSAGSRPMILDPGASSQASSFGCSSVIAARQGQRFRTDGIGARMQPQGNSFLT
jgi:hypothetical protein